MICAAGEGARLWGWAGFQSMSDRHMCLFRKLRYPVPLVFRTLCGNAQMMDIEMGYYLSITAWSSAGVLTLALLRQCCSCKDVWWPTHTTPFGRNLHWTHPGQQRLVSLLASASMCLGDRREGDEPANTSARVEHATRDQEVVATTASSYGGGDRDIFARVVEESQAT